MTNQITTHPPEEYKEELTSWVAEDDAAYRQAVEEWEAQENHNLPGGPMRKSGGFVRYEQENSGNLAEAGRDFLYSERRVRIPHAEATTITHSPNVYNESEHQQVRADEARGAVEVIHEREQLIDNILNQANGTVAVHTSLPKEVSRANSSGFQTFGEGKLKGLIFTALVNDFRSSNNPNIDTTQAPNFANLREAIVFTPRTEPIFEELASPKKRILGKPKQAPVQKIVGRNPVLSQNGEQIIQIHYETHQPPILDLEKAYYDYSGRGGNMLVVDFELPRSVAKELNAVIKNGDPQVIRDIVERMTLAQGVSEHDWKTGVEGYGGKRYPVRPPYDKWDEPLAVVEPAKNTMHKATAVPF
jgi:hypothetical protein